MTETLAAAWLSAALFLRIVPVSLMTLGTPVEQAGGLIDAFLELHEPMLFAAAVMLVLPHAWAFDRLAGPLLLGSRFRTATLRMIDGFWGVAALCASHAFAVTRFRAMRQGPGLFAVADALVWSGAVPFAATDLVVAAIAIGWVWRRRRRRGVDGAIRFPRAVLPALYGLAWFVHLEVAAMHGGYFVAAAVRTQPSMSETSLDLTLGACALLAVLSLIRPGRVPAHAPADPAAHFE